MKAKVDLDEARWHRDMCVRNGDRDGALRWAIRIDKLRGFYGPRKEKGKHNEHGEANLKHA